MYNTQFSDAQFRSVLSDVRDYMQQLWDAPFTVEAQVRETDKSLRLRQRLLDAAAAYAAGSLPQEDWYGPDATLPAARITLLSGGISPGPKAPELGAILNALMLEARESVVLQSPYVILDPELLSFLEALDGKGLECEILTNSVAASPNPTARAVYFHDRRVLAGMNLGLLEYQGPDSLHAKTYLIDRRMVLLGSYNLDPRSARIDTELMLVIDSPDLAEALRQVQDRFRANALEVGPDGRYLAGGPAPARVSWSKAILTRLMTLPARWLRFLV